MRERPDPDAIVQSTLEAGASAFLIWLGANGDSGPDGEPCITIHRTPEARLVIEAFARKGIGCASDDGWVLTCQDLRPDPRVRSFDAKAFAIKAMVDVLVMAGCQLGMGREDTA